MKTTDTDYEREVGFHVKQGRARDEAERLVAQDMLVPAGQSFPASKYRKLFEAAQIETKGDFELPPMERKFVRDQE